MILFNCIYLSFIQCLYQFLWHENIIFTFERGKIIQRYTWLACKHRGAIRIEKRHLLSVGSEWCPHYGSQISVTNKWKPAAAAAAAAILFINSSRVGRLLSSPFRPEERPISITRTPSCNTGSKAPTTHRVFYKSWNNVFSRNFLLPLRGE